MADVQCRTCGHSPHVHWPNVLGKNTTNCIMCEGQNTQKICDNTMFSVAYEAAVSETDKIWSETLEELCGKLEMRADELIDPGPEVIRWVIKILKALAKDVTKSG